jgi:hypothetical protein
LAIAYCLPLALLIPGGRLVYAAAAVSLFGLVYGLNHYIFYGALFSRLFPRAPGCNAVGVIEPEGEVRQQVLVVGHHDSPYVFSFLSHCQKLGSIRLLLAMTSYLYLFLLAGYAAVSQAWGAGRGSLRGLPLFLALAGLAFAVPLFFLVIRQPSPGAGDNLNASVAAVTAASFFSSRRELGLPLRHTRLMLLSTDGEEVGQSGARAFVRRHREGLLAVPTFVLNVDSVYRLRDLAVLTCDRNGTLPLSARMVADCRTLARDLGCPLKRLHLPLGGGGTDAAAFARMGVQATTLIGVSSGLFSGGRVYHTLQDTVDRLEPAAVEAMLDMIVNYVLYKDESPA